MGTITLAAGGTIPRISVRCFVDGALRSDLYCTGIDLGLGTSGAAASLEATGLTWDQAKGLVGRELRVTVDGVPAFAGIIHSRGGELSRGSNRPTLSGVSFAGMMDTVFVGQARVADDVEFRYPQFARHTTAQDRTGWTIQSILRDIFGSSAPTWRGGGANIPSGWQSRLRLGSLAVFERGYNQFPIGDITYRLTTLAEAIDQLLGIVKTVSFRERFTGGATYLDFFELGDGAAPARRVIVARPGEHIDTVGANVVSIGRNDSLEGVRSRVIGCGSTRKTMISVTTEHPTCPLRKGWDEDGEELVLSDPELVQKYPRTISAEIGGEIEHVFRRYYLPDAIRALRVDEKNALRSSAGEEVEIQVWKRGRTYTQEEDGSWSSVESAVPELIEGAKVEPRGGLIELPAPAINLVSATVAFVGEEAEIVETYQEAVVGVTLTVAGKRLVSDTGIDGSEGVADGLVAQLINESFELLRVNGTVGGHSFTSCWFHDEALGWDVISGETLVRSDEALLRTYTALAQREQNRMRASYNVTLPFHTDAWRVGDRMTVVGEDGYDHGTHQVRSVRWDLTRNHRTTLSTDSQVPLVYQNLGEI